jgi:hypothetical protein
MKLQIKLLYSHYQYDSSITEVTQKEVDEAYKIAELAAQGKLSFLVLEFENRKYYFSKEILKTSIITVIFEK